MLMLGTQGSLVVGVLSPFHCRFLDHLLGFSLLEEGQQRNIKVQHIDDEELGYRTREALEEYFKKVDRQMSCRLLVADQEIIV